MANPNVVGGNAGAELYSAGYYPGNAAGGLFGGPQATPKPKELPKDQWSQGTDGTNYNNPGETWDQYQARMAGQNQSGPQPNYVAPTSFDGISPEAAANLPQQISQGFSGYTQQIASDRAAGGGDPNSALANPQQIDAQNRTDKAAADKAAAGPLSGPGPLEQWSAANAGAFDKPSSAESLYGQHGQDLINTPSASETLYGQGMRQMDPYYDYAQQKATRSINDAAAARGNWNSSNATNNIRDSAANLYGQQAMQMGARASAADSAKLGRYGAAENEAGSSDSAYNTRVSGAESLYGNWQQAQEGRLGGAQTSATQLAGQQANTVEQAYQKAGDLSNADNLEAFNAQLQKLGIDPKSSAVQDFIKTLGAGGSIATALAK